MRNDSICTNNRIISNRDISQNHSTRTYHYVISNARSFAQATCFRPFASDGYTLKNFAIFTDNSFRMHHAANSSMIENRSITNLSINRYRTSANQMIHQFEKS